MAARVVVVGSLNYDIAVWVPRRPQGDETLHGSRCEENAGGKGANQAVAASRLEAEVTMIGCVGSDSRGDYLIAELDAAGVDRNHVYRGSTETGTALITIDPEDVSIVVIAGANAELDSERVELAASEISKKGIEIEVVDLRTIAPFDAQTCIDSVLRTGRLLVLQEAQWTGGLGNTVSSRILEEAFWCLETPPVVDGALDTPVPFSPTLEDHTMPTVDLVIRHIERMC